MTESVSSGMKNKPYSESCDQNKDVILNVIEPLLANCHSVFEIGSGTGQHAIHFAENMPHLSWYTSDRKSYHDAISAWLSEADLDNCYLPIELDVATSEWPAFEVDAVFTANSLHIMHQEDLRFFMDGASKLLKPQGSLIIYGPFNYAGAYTSDSNERFDQWLKDGDVFSGIKDFEEISDLADRNAMLLAGDYEMPANNRILHYIKK